jgi:pheromone alpha factor receptor
MAPVALDHTMTINATDPTFSVFHQNFTLMSVDGTTPFTASTDDINVVKNLAVKTAIIFSFQLGASIMLLFVLLLMTTSMKRRSLSFIFNVLALICNIIRCTIMCTEMTGIFMDFVLVIMQVYYADGIYEAIRLSVANSVMTTLLFIFLQFALITQVHVVALAASRLQRRLVMGFCCLISAMAIGFRLNLMVVNCQNTTNVNGLTKEGIAAQNWAQSSSNICGIVSICIFSFVFCVKLALAIKSRRQMGLKQFGAMQIIFIMGCQTLLIPGRSFPTSTVEHLLIKSQSYSPFSTTTLSRARSLAPLSKPWSPYSSL